MSGVQVTAYLGEKESGSKNFRVFAQSITGKLQGVGIVCDSRHDNLFVVPEIGMDMFKG